jgi:PilZ domain-containing protein
MQRFGPGERPREGFRAGERRRCPRIALALPVKACGEVSGLLHDISRTGLCLFTEEPLEAARIVSFQLVDDVSGQSYPFEARVVWYRPGMPGRAGLEFVNMRPEQDAWLASRFVDWLTGALLPGIRDVAGEAP